VNPSDDRADVSALGPVVGPAIRFADVEGMRVAYQAEGTGPLTLVLLHGFSSSRESWLMVAAPLAERYRVISLDRPGFGLTQLPTDPDERRRLLSPAGEVAVTLALLDQLDLDHVVLIGHSMGGAIAAEVALAAPDRVVGLVLVDAAIGDAFGPRASARRLAGSRLGSSVGPKVVAAAAPRAMRFFLPLIYDDPRRVPIEIRDAYRRMLRNRDWSTGLWEMAAYHEASDLADRVHQIDAPTLVITGDRDRIVPPEVAFGLARVVPEAQLVVVARCGHSPHEERPDEFVAAVQPFLEDLAAARREGTPTD
jgi:pimeloyl-ACP methyl ester carboxylesterase